MLKKIIQTIIPKQGPAIIGPYSVGKIYNGTAYISGQLGIDPKTNELISGCVEEQTHQILKNLDHILTEAGSGMDRVLKCTVYLLTMDDFSKVNGVYAKYFKDQPPARVCIAVSQLPKGGKVEIDAIAVVNEPETNAKESFSKDNNKTQPKL